VRFPSALAQQSGATQLESLKGNLDIFSAYVFIENTHIAYIHIYIPQILGNTWLWVHKTLSEYIVYAFRLCFYTLPMDVSFVDIVELYRLRAVASQQYLIDKLKLDDTKSHWFFNIVKVPSCCCFLYGFP